MKFKSIQQSFFFGLLALVTVTFMWLIHDFLFPMFWAVVFAIIFYPFQKWWLKRTKGMPSLSSILTILTITILIFTPLFFVGSLAVKESITYYQLLSDDSGNNGAGVWFTQLMESTVFLERYGIQRSEVESVVGTVAGKTAQWLGSQAFSFGQNTFKATLLFFLMLYILFYVLKEGPKLEERLIEILPLGDAKERRLFKKFTSTTRATIKGTFVIAVIQGIMGGVLFTIAGIGAPFLWGTLMGLLSVVPALGPGIIWLPAGILLLIGGNIWQGVLVIIGGAAIISLVDNLLRPVLVGKDTEMPDVLILLSTLGGLAAFGISGFIIGPIIAAFFLSMWHMFEEEFKKDLELYG